jgi:hypothetical protein
MKAFDESSSAAQAERAGPARSASASRLNGTLPWLAACCLAIGFYQAQTCAIRAADAKSIARFLDERTVAVLRMEPGSVDIAGLLDRFTVGAAVDAETLASTRRQWSDWTKDLHAAGAKELYVVASLADVPDGPPFVVVPLHKDADEKKLANTLKQLGHFDRSFADPLVGERPFHRGPFAVQRIGDALVWGSLQQRQRLRTNKPAVRSVIVSAFTDAAALRLVLVPTSDAARIFEETIPTLPDELGGGSIKLLSRGLKSVTIDLDTLPKRRARITIRCTDTASAKAIDAVFQKGTKSLGENASVRKWFPSVARLPALWKPRLDDNQLEQSIEESALAEIARPFVTWVIEEEQRARASAQMHRVLQAILAYEAKNGTFPAFASRDKAGKPLLSWRVHLLPYLGEEALFKQFKLDEPWDSKHNSKLIPKMPAVFRPTISKAAEVTRTTFMAPLGEKTMFPPTGTVRAADVFDGTSKTILLVDVHASKAVVWTRPDDLKYDAKDPFRELARYPGGEIMVGTADGTVHFLPKTIEKATLAALFTRNGGEPVEIP